MLNQAEIGDAVQFLDLLSDYFANERHWTRGAYHDHGKRCLVGAIRYLGRRHLIETTAAVKFLRDALPWRYLGLETFNDGCGDIAELRAVIVNARSRALFEAAETRKRNDEAQALMAAEAEEQKRRMAAAPRYRELILARLERERAARAAAGDERAIYMLCPELPAEERLAA